MLMKIGLDSCQKFRQFPLGAIIALLLAVSCIQKPVNAVDKQSTLNKSISLLTLESECQNQNGSTSPFFNEVQAFLADIKSKRTVYTGNIFETWTYDFQSPMVVNEEIMRAMMRKISNENELNILAYKSLNQLDEYSRRFEGKKCQFRELSEKQKTDIRPYLNVIHSNDTSDENLLNLCRSTERASLCAAQVIIAKKQQKLSLIIDHYKKEFEEKIFNPMFMLRDQHNQFSCNKISETETELNINVFNQYYDEGAFENLLGAIQDTWSKNGLKIKFNRVSTDSSDVLKIIPMNGGISFVSYAQPMTIHLSNDLDMMTIRRVVAHEFGHILGFPDCYIEFFNSNTSQLIYYEISDKNFNLMCSVKFGAKVEDDYIDQIKQKSCKF